MYNIKQLAWLKRGCRRTVVHKNLLTTLLPTAHCLFNSSSSANLRSLRFPLFQDIIGWDVWTTLSSMKNQCQENTLKRRLEPKTYPLNYK